MNIRPATSHDFEAVHRLLLEAGLPTEGLEDQFGPAYAVAVDRDRVIGAAGVERYGDSGLLRSVVTAPERRGEGIGLALTRDRLGWATKEGIADVYLLTTTAADWFPRLGFGRVERRDLPAEIQGSREANGVCPSTAVAMRRPSGSG